MDVTKQARQALAIQYTKVASWAWDVDTGDVHAEKELHELLLLPPEVPVSAELVLSRVHEDDIESMQAALTNTVENLTPYDFQFRMCGDDGQIRWIRGEGQVHETHPNGTAKVVIGINYDVTPQVEAAERLEAVAQEMKHRVKNCLAMVNSLATVTAREYQDVDQFIEHFRGRVEALASAQNIGLSADVETRADLAPAIEGALAPFTASTLWKSRFEIAVGEARIGQSLTQAICLVLYELGTNAVKYGALRFDVGQIKMSAHIHQNRLHVDWAETYSPQEPSGQQAAPSPDSSGFGNRLVTRLVASEGGEIDIIPEDGSYQVRLSFPV